MTGPPSKRSADDDWARIRAWVEFLLGGLAAAALANAVLSLAGLLNATVNRSELLVLVAVAAIVVGFGALLVPYLWRFSLDDHRQWVPVTGGALIGAGSAIGSATFQAALLFYG